MFSIYNLTRIKLLCKFLISMSFLAYVSILPPSITMVWHQSFTVQKTDKCPFGSGWKGKDYPTEWSHRSWHKEFRKKGMCMNLGFTIRFKELKWLVLILWLDMQNEWLQEYLCQHVLYDSESEININVLSTGDVKQSRKMSGTKFEIFLSLQLKVTTDFNMCMQHQRT